MDIRDFESIPEIAELIKNSGAQYQDYQSWGVYISFCPETSARLNGALWMWQIMNKSTGAK